MMSAMQFAGLPRTIARFRPGPLRFSTAALKHPITDRVIVRLFTTTVIRCVQRFIFYGRRGADAPQDAACAEGRDS